MYLIKFNPNQYDYDDIEKIGTALRKIIQEHYGFKDEVVLTIPNNIEIEYRKDGE